MGIVKKANKENWAFPCLRHPTLLRCASQRQCRLRFASRPPHPSRLPLAPHFLSLLFFNIALCLLLSFTSKSLHATPLFPPFFSARSDTPQKDTTHSHDLRPKRAALLSTFLPGLGQAYNHKYWKIPIVYSLIGTLGYIAWKNHQNYITFRNALRSRYDNDPNTTDNFPNLNDQVLKAQREYYRRNRDLFIIFSSLAYGLNILDAYVDAHLNGFTVSDKLSLKPIPHFNHFQIALIWNIN